MKRDIGRFIVLITVGFLIGLWFSRPILGIVSGLAVYCYLLVRDSRRLYEWLHESPESDPPDLRGYHGEVAAGIKALRGQSRQREERLGQYLNRFQEAASALPDAILILNQDDRIEWANQRAREYLGIRWPQDAGQRLANLIRHPKLLVYLKQQKLSGDTQGVTLPSPEDSSLQIEYRVTPYGENLRLLVARDVSQIRQTNQMRRDFIANASHELRSPLTVIAGYLESMDGEDEINAADIQPRIRQMRIQASRMQTLIEDLLMLSSLETVSQGRYEETVAVPDMIAGLQDEAATLSGDRGHHFELNIDQGLLVKGDHKELYSAFSNLVVNAVQYTPAGGMIRLHWYQDDSGAHMEVADTGEGIAPEHIPRLTERFYRIDKGRSRESGGTGLGLAIVKHIMNRHRGRLHIESQPGKGSTFRCDFPSRMIVRKNGRRQVKSAG